MKIPKTFVSKKDIVRGNKKYVVRNKETLRLKDLILKKQDYIKDNEIDCDDFKDIYNFLELIDMKEMINVEYEDVFVDILEFLDENLLKSNLENIIKCKDSFNKEHSSCISNLLIKDMYAVFIYSIKFYSHPKVELIKAYKKLGFEEV